MKIHINVLVIILIFILSGCSVIIGGTGQPYDIIDEQTFIDDIGNKIIIDDQYSRIVSLSATHTENIYYLGAGNKVIGVDHKSIFPYAVTEVPHYTLSNEAEIKMLIEANPDLILIEPATNKMYPHVVSRLESEGFEIVSLMPETVDDFEGYIFKLGMLLNCSKKAKLELANYEEQLKNMENAAKAIKDKKHVFVETSEKGYYTPAKGSLLYKAIEIAGGKNIVENPRPNVVGDADKKYGFKKTLAHKDDIDVYFTLQGKASPGGNIESIRQQPKFNEIKAVKEGEVYELLNPLVNRYTFRYIDGVRDIGMLLYPEIFRPKLYIEENRLLMREDMAKILYHELYMQVFTITRSDYYEFEKYNHAYGGFQDIDYLDTNYNIIESVVMRAYISPVKDDTGHEWFYPKNYVKKAEIAKLLYVALAPEKVENITITDIEGHEEARIIQKIVNSGLMTVSDGKFNPDQAVTVGDFNRYLEIIKEQLND